MPYSQPRLTTAEFEAMRAAYIGKNGYTIYIPGWEDFIHIPIERSVTEKEEIAWKRKDWDAFTPTRIDEIKAIKERRRLQYRRLLGSPQPRILRNRGSILVAIDNNQDALSTLSSLARIAVPLLPLVFQKILEGPVGWIMLTADVLNLCTRVMTPERSSLRSKRVKDAVTDLNPFSEKARTKRGIKFWSSKITAGNIIEGLQTSDQMFGYGISLGAIMNLPFDAAAGAVRSLGGEKISLIRPITKHVEWAKSASSAWKSLCLLYTTEGILGLVESAPMLILAHIVAMSMQAAMPMLDPLNLITEPENYEVEAMYPTRSYLREVIEEEGDDPDKHIGWPITDTKWASCIEIAAKGKHVAAKNFKDDCFKNRYKMQGLLTAKIATEAAYYAITAAGGNGIIETDFIAAEKITHALLNAGYRLPYYLAGESGWWYQKVNDLNAPRVRVYPEGISLDNQIDNIEITDFAPEIIKEANEQIDKVGEHHGIFKYQASGMRRADIPGAIRPLTTLYEIYQFTKYGRPEELNILSNSALPLLSPFIMPKIIQYFKDYESEGLTPTTPQFMSYCKDTFGMTFPQNKTTD